MIECGATLLVAGMARRMTSSTASRPPSMGSPAWREQRGLADFGLPAADRAAAAAPTVWIERHVADLAAEAERACHGPAIDDQAATHANLAGDEQQVVDLHARAAPMLGQRPQVRLVGHDHAMRSAQRLTDELCRAARPTSPGWGPSPRRRRCGGRCRRRRRRHPRAARLRVVVAERRQTRAEAARSAIVASDDDACVRGRSTRAERRTLPPRPTMAADEVVDGDLEGQHDGAIRAQPDERRRPAGHAQQRPAALLDEARAGQLADQHADARCASGPSARQAPNGTGVPRHGARGRSRSGWPSGLFRF